MTATSLFRPLLPLTRFLQGGAQVNRSSETRTSLRLDDRQLAEQLMKDTGRAPEDLVGRPAYDETLPFFMQRNFK